MGRVSHPMFTGAGRLTRRGFLRGLASAVVAAPWIIPASSRGADGAAPPSKRITVALIGCGVMGRGHLRRLVSDPAVQLLAVSDVDRVRRDEGKRVADEAYADERACGAYSGCDAVNDFRQVLARPDIDAVVIVTPDHWHAPLSIAAARAGKDIYCEKPITLKIEEGRRLVEAVRRCGRVFQTGTQYRSIPTIRQVCAFVRGGGLGKIKSVFTLWGKTRADGVGPSFVPINPDLPAEPVPDGLDWDLWVGPAPWHAYNRLYHRNPAPGVVPWSFCDDFGAASVTGFHSHAADVIQYALGVETSGPVEIIHPDAGLFPTLTCRYANGTLLHHVKSWSEVAGLYGAVTATARLAGMFGGLFVGELGWVTSMTGSGPIEAAPEEILQRMGLASRNPMSRENDHHANWFECIRTRRSPSCDEEIGHRSASLGHLVTLTCKLGRSLKWDPAREEFPGDQQANRLLSRAMREPWRT